MKPDSRKPAPGSILNSQWIKAALIAPWLLILLALAWTVRTPSTDGPVHKQLSVINRSPLCLLTDSRTFISAVRYLFTPMDQPLVAPGSTSQPVA